MKVQFIAACAIAALLSACSSSTQQLPDYCITPEKFGSAQVDGKDLQLYTLVNKNGVAAQFTNLGAKVVSLYAPDRDGKFSDIVLGYSTAAEYAEAATIPDAGIPEFGAVIGPYANRIAEGRFSLDDHEYFLDINEGTNHLHGGKKGFKSSMWEAKKLGDNKIEFSIESPAGEMGYPSNMKAKVIYELNDSNELVIDYDAETDIPTVINLTNHSFFNLAGEGTETINDHELQIISDRITPVDDHLIPTGEFLPVEGTAFDFNKMHAIGDSLDSPHEQMQLGHGYDHNWVLTGEPDANGLRLAAKVHHKGTGRTLEVRTTEPGLQFYGGNFLKGDKGKDGKTYPHRSALCLETQHFPDSPNKTQFPSVELRPGQRYAHKCVYRLGVE